jgi:hypothetical protein
MKLLLIFSFSLLTIGTIIFFLNANEKTNSFRQLRFTNTASLRNHIQVYEYSKNTLPHYLKSLMIQFRLLKISRTLQTREEMIPYATLDFMTRYPEATFEEAKELAETQIYGNKCYAFTAQDDTFFRLAEADLFDEFHEYIHILTAKGGRSELQEFNSDFNEGCVNYFTQLYMEATGTDYPIRYPQKTAFVKKLIDFLEDGEELLFNMTFKGEIEDFFAALGKAYVSGKTNPNGKVKSRMEKAFTAESMFVDGSAAQLMASKIKNWIIKWFIDRF